jgi:hypothetical protein
MADMKLNILVVLLAFALSTDKAVACNADGALFHDDFKTLDPTWGKGDFFKVENGALVVTTAASFTQVIINQAGFFGDGELCAQVSVSRSGDVSQSTIGLIFWSEGTSTKYVFALNPDGRFGLLRSVGPPDKWAHPIELQKSILINKGLDQWNELIVRTSGSHVSLFINRELAAEIDKGFPPDNGGLIGIFSEYDGDNPLDQIASFRDFTFRPLKK